MLSGKSLNKDNLKYQWSDIKKLVIWCMVNYLVNDSENSSELRLENSDVMLSEPTLGRMIWTFSEATLLDNSDFSAKWDIG